MFEANTSVSSNCLPKVKEVSWDFILIATEPSFARILLTDFLLFSMLSTTPITSFLAGQIRGVPIFSIPAVTSTPIISGSFLLIAATIFNVQGNIASFSFSFFNSFDAFIFIFNKFVKQVIDNISCKYFNTIVISKSLSFR